MGTEGSGRHFCPFVLSTNLPTITISTSVFLHQVSDAGIGVDDDFVGQTHLAAAIAFFRAEEMLAKGPVVIRHRHADRCIRIHHLLGRNDFQLVRIGVEPEIGGNALDFLVRLLDQLYRPFRLLRQPADMGGILNDVAHLAALISAAS